MMDDDPNPPALTKPAPSPRRPTASRQNTRPMTFGSAVMSTPSATPPCASSNSTRKPAPPTHTSPMKSTASNHDKMTSKPKRTKPNAPLARSNRGFSPQLNYDRLRNEPNPISRIPPAGVIFAFWSGSFYHPSMRALPYLIGLLLLAGGCTVGRTYEVSVKNATDEPITIWLTKDGPPAEDQWLSPEQIAINTPEAPQKIGGVVVPPGKSANAGPLKGQFYSDVHAILRVYAGQLTLAQLLAVSRGSPNRIDQILPPGASRWVVEDGVRFRIQPAP